MGSLKQQITQRLEQRLSPQQILVAKLLELPADQLSEAIKQEVESNPALDLAYEAETPAETQPSFWQQATLPTPTDNEPNTYENEPDEDPEDILPPELKEDDQWQAGRRLAPGRDEDDEEDPSYTEPAAPYTLQDYLKEQLPLLGLSEQEETIAEYLIWELDSSGYLRRPPEELADELALNAAIYTPPQTIEQLIKKLQTLEPPGIFARNLQECLLIQLNKLHRDKPEAQLARTLIEKHLQELAAHKFDQILGKLKIDEQQLRKALDLISRLNPYPATAFTDERTKKASKPIFPDFELWIEEGQVKVALVRSHTPRLRISKHVVQLLSNPNHSLDHQTMRFLKKKLERARWFRNALLSREQTLLKIVRAIAEAQKDFFLHGGDISVLKPLTLNHIAEATGFDVSTVSRAVRHKYVSTPFGIYPLKFFFSEGLERQDGEMVSTTTIKQLIKKMVQGENPLHPLTDEQIAKELQKMGYKIARRTVAKYREQMGIPVARLRRRL